VTAVTDNERGADHSGPTAPHPAAPLRKARIARVLLGVVLIALTLTGAIGAWGWIGVVPLLTAAMGSCPLYSVLGFSTCPTNKA
jgi:hypothetical protein